MIRRPPRSTLFPYPPLSRSLAREAEPAEPQRIVLPEPRGEDVRLPGARRQLEAVEQLQHGREPLRPLGPRVRGDALPAEQEAHEVGRRHRLDLLAQATEPVAGASHQQPPPAPP